MIPPRAASFGGYGGMPGRSGSFGGFGGPGGYGGAAPGDDLLGCVEGGSNSALTYVGPGQGEYVQRTTFEYVGRGGDYGVIQQRRGAQWIICVPLAGCLLLPFLWWLLSPVLDSIRGSYDCHASPETWGRQEQRWCCKQLPDLPVCMGVPHHSKFPHGLYPTMEQCQRTNWEMDPWYDAFKQYCCGAQRVGCHAVRSDTNNPECFYSHERKCHDFHSINGKNWVKEQDCGKKNWVYNKWSENYQGYCCSTYGYGCNAIQTDLNDPVCEQDASNAQCPSDQACYEQDWVSDAWSYDFRSHCCRTQQRGCDAVRSENNFPPLSFASPA